MYRLISLSALFFLSVHTEPRTPKIYNVLISSNKNLSPSHALPVYEPVLRTTSLGIALPIFYQTPFVTYQTPLAGNLIPQPAQPVSNTQKDAEGAGEAGNDNQPLPIAQFIPYNYAPISSQHFYTQASQTASPPRSIPVPDNSRQNEDPRAMVANLKRNPEIPDVPPPALPVRNT